MPSEMGLYPQQAQRLLKFYLQYLVFLKQENVLKNVKQLLKNSLDSLRDSLIFQLRIYRTNKMVNKLSPSSLNLMADCPRCFWLQFNKDIKRPAGIFPSLPSGMDRILKTHFDSFMKKGELPPELKDWNIDCKLFNNEELLKVWRNNLKGIPWTDEKGNLFRGAVDNILVKGKKLVVLDYKTRGFPLKDDTAEHYQDQLDIYNFLLRKNGYETEDYAYLLFYHPNKVTEDGDVV